jgi:hypothetical protein
MLQQSAHHSCSGSSGNVAGFRVFASTLGDLFCTSSTSGSLMRSAWDLLRYSFVSSLVEKLQRAPQCLKTLPRKCVSQEQPRKRNHCANEQIISPVHQNKTDFGTGLGARVLNLICNEIQKCLPILHLQQRFCLCKTHGRAQASIQLQDSCLGQEPLRQPRAEQNKFCGAQHLPHFIVNLEILQRISKLPVVSRYMG